MSEGSESDSAGSAIQRAAQAVADAERYLCWCLLMYLDWTYVQNARDNLERCDSELKALRLQGQVADRSPNGGSSFL